MASPTRRTWVWVGSGSWWWIGKPGVLQSMGSERVRHDWATEQTELIADLQCCVGFCCTAHQISYTYIHSFSDSIPRQVIEYWVELLVLYSRSLLVIYFNIYSVYILVSISQFIHPPPRIFLIPLAECFSSNLKKSTSFLKFPNHCRLVFCNIWPNKLVENVEITEYTKCKHIDHMLWWYSESDCCKSFSSGASQGLNGKESSSQRRGHKFDPWSGTVPQST